VLALTCGDPPGEMTHWTGRAMAKTVSLCQWAPKFPQKWALKIPEVGAMVFE